MGMSMIPLLLHSDSVSEGARRALRAVAAAPLEARAGARQAAARLLFAETELECQEVLDLVGLPSDARACTRCP